MSNYGLTGPELYSERTFPTNFDVLSYNSIPTKARKQIYQRSIVMLGDYFSYPSKRDGHESVFWDALKNLKQRRGIVGYEELISDPVWNHSEIISRMRKSAYSKSEAEFFMLLTYVDRHDYLLCLDLIELLSRWINVYCEKDFSKQVDDMINDVFRSNGIGYEVIDNQIIHKANDVVHSEVVRPSLYFLSDKTYQGANEEMLRAFSEFKNSNYLSAIQNASNAFESTMKIIIEKNGWEVVSRNGQAPRLNNASANVLIHTISENSEIEKFHRAALKGLKESLQALSTLRNEHTGHGRGSEIRETYIQHCEFALHTAATNILYLIKAYG